MAVEEKVLICRKYTQIFGDGKATCQQFIHKCFFKKKNLCPEKFMSVAKK